MAHPTDQPSTPAEASSFLPQVPSVGRPGDDALDEASGLLHQLDGDAMCPVALPEPTIEEPAPPNLQPPRDAPPETTTIWGLPLARLTYAETLDQVDRLVRRGEPSFFITANLHYARLSDADPRLAAVNRQAAFLLADGMPMVWFSRLSDRPLPERVAGSDLIFMLAQRAAEKGYRIFMLGGTHEVATTAAQMLEQRHTGLQIVGVETPMLSELSAEEHRALVDRVAASKADLLLVAFGQPKGELWLAENYRALGVPACVQLGASFDFVAGRVHRAPKWMQRTGLEWFYRTVNEPRRMLPRYAADAAFLARALLREATGRSTTAT